MKQNSLRILSCLLALLMLLLPLTACSGNTPGAPADTTGTGTPDTDTPEVVLPSVYQSTYDVINIADDAFVSELRAKTQAKIDAIMNNNTTLKPAEGGKTYYVSSLNGNDKADGLTPETAWKTLDRVAVKQRKTIVAGDVVAFERGSVFYCYSDDGYAAFTAKSGVSYTAYGEGAKPIFTTAMGNSADPSFWTQTTDNPNVWVTKRFLDHQNIGNVVFNDGESQGEFHSLEYYDEDPKGATGNAQTGLPFSGPQDLSFDGQFYFYYTDTMTTGELYLYCSGGNPGEVYDSIYFCRDIHVINANETENVVIDNLAVRYGGAHGIVAGPSKNFTVQNCEIAFIGGSIQVEYTSDNYRRWPTRYGNGVEAYGAVDGFRVDNCYAHHIYDEAFTTQYDGSVAMLDVHYTNNVTMYCRQAASLWGASEVSTVEFSDNHCWYSSYGNPSKLHPFYGEDGGAVELQIKAFGENVDFIMKNNLVAFAGAFLSDFAPGYESYQFDGNVYVGEDTCYLGVDGTPYHWDDSAVEAMKTQIHDETAEMYVYMTESYDSQRTQETMTVPADVKAGDTVTFGAYEQDNDFANGAEEIEWIVLEVKDGKALLLSKKILDVSYFYPSESSLFWGPSTIREFLEGKFLSRAFTEEEVAKMAVVTVGLEPNDKYNEYGEDTGAASRVFILSAQELIGYLGEDGLGAEATEYALGREGFSLDIPSKDGGATYWTRNYGKNYKFAGTVTWSGAYDPYGAFWWTSASRGIRPAMWVEVG